MRLKCLRISVNLRPSCPRRNLSQENARGHPSTRLLQSSSLDQRRQVLSKLVQQIQKTPKGEQRTLPENHLDVLATEIPHTLLSDDPAIKWISFLLQDHRAYLATRVLSTYLHRGVHISLDAMQYICNHASKLNGSSAATAFAEHTSRIASTQLERALPILDQLILIFYNHDKHDAVLILGSLVLQENGITIGLLQYRRILQSIFKLHQPKRIRNPRDQVKSIETLMSMLENWMEARRRNETHLDQYDIAILLQGLSRLLEKHHRRQYMLPRHLYSQIRSFITVLVQHVSTPVTKLTLAEIYLNSYEAVARDVASKKGGEEKGGIVQVGNLLDPEIIAWSEKWQKLIGSGALPRKPRLEWLGLLTAQARALKVLTRDHINRRETKTEAVVSRVHRIRSIQTRLADRISSSNNCSHRNLQSELLLRQYAKDARLRFAGTIVRVCSAYLRTQDVGALLVALPFTRHLDDLSTFVRIWKRAIHLGVHLRRWEGPEGLHAMLMTLARSVPPSWGPSTIGDVLFDASNLLEDTLYVALGSSLRAGKRKWGGAGSGGPGTTMSSNRTNKIVQLIHEKPHAYREWGRFVLPFTRPLRLPWRDTLLKADGDEKGLGDASILLLKRMERKPSIQGRIQ